MVLVSRNQPSSQGDDEKRQREDERSEIRLTKILITVIGTDEDGQEAALGSYLEPLSKEDARRLMCHGSAIHGEYVDAGNAMEHELFAVLCWFVAESWRSFSCLACKNAIERGDCEGHGSPVDLYNDHGPADQVRNTDPPQSGSAFAAWLNKMDILPSLREKTMPECDGECKECPLWDQETDSCDLANLDDDQDKLDALS